MCVNNTQTKIQCLYRSDFSNSFILTFANFERMTIFRLFLQSNHYYLFDINNQVHSDERSSFKFLSLISEYVIFDNNSVLSSLRQDLKFTSIIKLQLVTKVD